MAEWLAVVFRTAFCLLFCVRQVRLGGWAWLHAGRHEIIAEVSKDLEEGNRL